MSCKVRRRQTVVEKVHFPFQKSFIFPESELIGKPVNSQLQMMPLIFEDRKHASKNTEQERDDQRHLRQRGISQIYYRGNNAMSNFAGKKTNV